MTNNRHIENYNAVAEEYGTVEYKGEEYALTDIAFFESTIRGFLECVYYRCPAIDKDGNTYDVYWEIDPDYDPECLDETLACDWDSPSLVKLIDRAEW